MKTFRITSTSWALAIFSMLVIIFSGVLLLIRILPNNSYTSVIATLSLLGIGLYLQRFISTAKIEVVLTKEFVTIKWFKQYLFHKEPDRKIPFNEIKSYKYQEDRNFDLFQITFIDDTELNIWHFTFTKDDFETLVYTFPEFVKDHNKTVKQTEENKGFSGNRKKIERAKTLYENANSPFIVIFAIFSILAILIIMFFKGNSIANPFLGFSAITGAIFYLSRYFKYRKEGKEKQD